MQLFKKVSLGAICLCTCHALLRSASCKMRRIAAQVSQSRVRQRSESPQPSRSQRRRTQPAEHSSRYRSPAATAVRGRGRGRGRVRNAAGRGRGRGQPSEPTPPPPGHESHGPTVNMFSWQLLAQFHTQNTQPAVRLINHYPSLSCTLSVRVEDRVFKKWFH